MFKKMSLVTILFLLIAGSQAFAQTDTHTSTSSLKLGATMTKPFQSMDLSTQTTAAPPIKKTKTPSATAYILPGVVAAFSIIGFGAYWFVYRKRHL